MKKHLGRDRRKTRIRKKIRLITSIPRLSVFRSNRHMYAQVIDDAKNTTIVGMLDKNIEGKTHSQRARKLGKDIAQKLLAKNVKRVVFDKGGYAYHGRVKEIADGAREGGLQF